HPLHRGRTSPLPPRRPRPHRRRRPLPPPPPASRTGPGDPLTGTGAESPRVDTCCPSNEPRRRRLIERIPDARNSLCLRADAAAVAVVLPLRFLRRRVRG